MVWNPAMTQEGRMPSDSFTNQFAQQFVLRVSAIGYSQETLRDRIRRKPMSERLKHTWRIAEILAALATLISFVDVYIFHSKLASALRLPPELPTGLFFAFAFMCVGIALFSVNRFLKQVTDSASVRAQVEIKMASLQSDLSEKDTALKHSEEAMASASERVRRLEAEIADFKAMADRAESLRKQVIAVLAARSKNEREIQVGLGIGRDDFESSRLLREVLGQLVSEGVIRKQLSSLEDYELSSRPPREAP